MLYLMLFSTLGSLRIIPTLSLAEMLAYELLAPKLGDSEKRLSKHRMFGKLHGMAIMPA